MQDEATAANVYLDAAATMPALAGSFFGDRRRAFNEHCGKFAGLYADCVGKAKQPVPDCGRNP
ncbi:hypothetical protein CR51_11935 [Caballeronia megalochromosomata]|nr:hypothetical protein CR51_11935 [Caballeronia megalochromosomata]